MWFKGLKVVFLAALWMLRLSVKVLCTLLSLGPDDDADNTPIGHRKTILGTTERVMYDEHGEAVGSRTGARVIGF